MKNYLVQTKPPAVFVLPRIHKFIEHLLIFVASEAAIVVSNLLITVPSIVFWYINPLNTGDSIPFLPYIGLLLPLEFLLSTFILCF